MPRFPRRNTTRSKSLRNLKSASTGILNASGKVASKATVGTFKYLANQTPAQTEYVRRQSTVMDAQWGINSSIAKMHLIVRRMERGNAYCKQFMDTGIEAGLFEKAFDWLIDNLLFVLELIWGFFEPILTMLWMTLVRAILIIACNVIFFGGLIWLLTA